MMKAAVIAALAIPVFTAGGYQADLQQARNQADTWGEHFQQVRTELAILGIDMDSLSATPCEQPETDDTVVIAEKGLFFDTAASSLIYLGNVRLKDTRVNISASEQLHIFLQKPNIEEKEEASPAPMKEPKETPPAAAGEADSTAAGIEAAEHMPETGPDGPPVSATSTTDQAVPQPEKSSEPAFISTHSAIADTVSNAIFLYSPAAGEEISLKQGESIVRITPQADAPARILADSQGNILLEGALVSVRMVDKDGGVTTLTTTGGHAYYHAADHTLHTPGNTELTHPDGTLSCNEALCVVLTPAAEASKPGKGFMSQFTSLRFDGITTATARGKVVATATAREGRPASRAEGELFTYDGKTGACALTGSKCRLVYGGNEVCSNEALLLHPNGDIELKGTDIRGTYEREGSQPGQMLAGTFEAGDNVIFRADLGTVSTQNGMKLADAESDFSCSGPVLLVLRPKENAKAPEQKPGMPNLAITRFGDVSRAKATGSVVAHRYETGTGKCIGELQAETAETDLTTGETLLTSAPGTPLVAFYNGSRIESTPAEGKTATLELKANGDLKLNGDQIAATMKSTDGITKARCRDYVLLTREEDRLETGSATRIETPTAILTTTGALHAILTSSQPAEDAPKGRFTNLRFNYDGIREARTHSGCTVRTESGSMQCTGPVHLVMDNTNKAADQMMGGLQTATARGNVAVAGKDSSGRLLRARGDLLEVNARTGMKVLSGRSVTLSDANNTHTASGKGASIRIDARNNASIHGAQHTTRATRIREQLNEQKNSKSK